MLEALLHPDSESCTLLSMAQRWAASGRTIHHDADMARLLLSGAQGLAHMHACHVIHADVKMENLLVDCGTMTAKWCDLTQASAGPTTKPSGTPGLMAPEQVVRNVITRRFEVTFATDVWSFGIMLLEAYSNRDLDVLERSLLDIIMKLRSSATYTSSRAAIQRYGPVLSDWYLEYHAGSPLVTLATKCLAANPSDRPAMAAVVDSLREFVNEAAAAAAADAEPGART